MKLFQFKIFFVIFALLLILSTCSKNYDELVPDLDGVPAGGVKSLRVLNVSEDTLNLEIKVFAVDHFGSFIKNLSIKDFSITDDGSNYNYRIVKLTEQKDEFEGAYSAGLLFDQSGSINSTDPSDDRITAGTSFAKLLNGGDEAAVAAFSGSSVYQYPYELLEDFSADTSILVQSIKGLTGNAGGGTPLYQAIYNLIPSIAADGKNKNKAIIAFTDGVDTEGGVSIDDLVNRACAEGVNIYTVGLSNGVDASVLSDIAFRTGGAVMLAQDALQLISLYSSLGELLRGEGRFYKIQMEIINPSNNWRPGYNLSGQLNLNLSSSYPVVLPFQVSLTNKNAGSLDNREPECDCTEVSSNDLISKWKNKATEYLNQYPIDPNLTTPNDKITCAYASIYQENPDKFKWAGLAAIVSGKIGVSIASKSWIENVVSENLTDLEVSIKAGNKAVYINLFWQHLAFIEGGMDEIEKIYCANGIGIDLYRAWLKISQGDRVNVWSGNKDLFRHEQQNLLQSIMYDPHPLAWSFLKAYDFLPGDPIIVSPVPGQDDVPGFWRINSFANRWNWIESNILPDWEAYEMDPTNKDSLKSVHEGYCSSCCD